MIHRLPLALLVATAAALPAHAQPIDAQPIPGYDEREQAQPDGPDDRYESAGARNNDDPRDAAPPRRPQGADQGSQQGWVQPPPYGRRGQVDEGTPDDAAHRADRAYTASLNRRTWPGRNAAARSASGATNGYAAEHARYQDELADHARAVQDYQAEQARYADRIARWRARANACEAGNPDACDGPE